MDKIIPMTKYSAMGIAGPPCDATNFSEYIAKNLQLYQFTTNHTSTDGRHEVDGETAALSLHAQVNFTRNELAQALRKGPYQVNLVYGGVDPRTKEAGLYVMDYLASLHPVPFGAQGYASYFCLSVMQRAYSQKTDASEITMDDAVAIIHQCIQELKTRFLIAQPNFLIKVVDAQGIRVLSQGADPAVN